MGDGRIRMRSVGRRHTARPDNQVSRLARRVPRAELRRRFRRRRLRDPARQGGVVVATAAVPPHETGGRNTRRDGRRRFPPDIVQSRRISLVLSSSVDSPGV